MLKLFEINENGNIKLIVAQDLPACLELLARSGEILDTDGINIRITDVTTKYSGIICDGLEVLKS